MQVNGLRRIHIVYPVLKRNRYRGVRLRRERFLFIVVEA